MDVGHRIGRYLWGRSSEKESREEKPRLPADIGVGVEDSDEAGVARAERAVQLLDGVETEEGVEAMDDERMQILKMVEEHKITAEEAAKLLAALDTGGRPADRVAGRTSRWIRIRVTDAATGRNKVNVNVPLDVVTAAGKLGARFGLTKYAEREGIDLDELIDSIRNGAVGKLVDVTNVEGGENVEIYVE